MRMFSDDVMGVCSRSLILVMGICEDVLNEAG